jgi:hypothetical protein
MMEAGSMDSLMLPQLVMDMDVVVQQFLLVTTLLFLASSAFAIFGRLNRGARNPDIRGVRAVVVIAPLVGLLAAAYNLMNMFLGVANAGYSADMAVLAPTMAESAFCVGFGAFLGIMAAILVCVLQLHDPDQSVPGRH